MNDQNDSVKERLVSLSVAIDKPISAALTIDSRYNVRARVWDVVEGAIQRNGAIRNYVDDEVEKP